jgi:hypothetical protein
VQCGDASGTGTVSRVPLAGGAPELVDATHYDYGPLVHDANDLYFPNVVEMPSESWHAGVGVHPLAGGATTVATSPGTAMSTLYVTDLWASDATSAVWLFSTANGTDPTQIAQMQGGKPVLIGAVPVWAFGLMVSSPRSTQGRCSATCSA